MIKLPLLFSLVFAFGIAEAKVVLGDTLKNENGNFFYYSDIDSEEKIQSFANQCSVLGQRLPTVFDIMNLKFSKFGPRLVEIDYTEPSLWNLWQGALPLEEQLNKYIEIRSDENWNIVAYSDNGTRNFVYASALRIKDYDDRLRDEYTSAYRHLVSTFEANGNTIPEEYVGLGDATTPDVYLTSSRHAGRTGSFTAWAPPTEEVGEPLVVGLASSLVRDPNKGPASAMNIGYPSAFPVSSIEPNLKFGWTNPRMRSGHVDRIDARLVRRLYDRVSGIIRENPNLRVSIQCVADRD